MKVKLMALFSVCGMLALGTDSASTTGVAECTVIPKLTVSRDMTVNNGKLLFSSAVPGAAPQTIAPADPQSAKFNVSGPAMQSISIMIDPSVSMVGPGTAISASLSASGPSLVLDASGNGSFRVGGTRAALPAAQAAGLYSGNFNVQVLY